MLNIKSLGIVQFGTNVLKIVGNPSLVRGVFLTTSFNDGNNKLVSVCETEKDSCYIYDEEGRGYYVTYTKWEGIEDEKHEHFYMLSAWDEERISLEKIEELFLKQMN